MVCGPGFSPVAPVNQTRGKRSIVFRVPGSLAFVFLTTHVKSGRDSSALPSYLDTFPQGTNVSQHPFAATQQRRSVLLILLLILLLIFASPCRHDARQRGTAGTPGNNF
jgi:hypothetical protein